MSNYGRNRNDYRRIPATEDVSSSSTPEIPAPCSPLVNSSRYQSIENLCCSAPNKETGLPTSKSVEELVLSMSYLTSTRFRIAILLLLAMMTKDMMSSNLSYAITCMVNSTGGGDPLSNLVANNSANLKCKEIHQNETGSYHGTLHWDSAMQGLIFSSFDWGLALIFFVGSFVDHLNPKYLVVGSTAVSIIATLVSPFAAINSFAATVFLRALLGFCNAILNPAVNTLTATWFPEDERNTAYAISTCGDQISAMIISGLTGVFCAISWANGWPLIFYFTGIVSLIFMLIWLLYISNSPELHRWISPSELNYLTKKMALEEAETPGNEDRISKHIPYKHLLTSPAVWATVCGTVGHELPLIILSLYLPTYLKDVLAYGVSENGWIGVLPKITFMLVKLLSSAFSDFLQQRFNFSKTILAKVFHSLGCIGLGTTLLATTFLTCEHRELATVLLILNQALAGFQVPGALGTLVSIAPRFTGSVCGMAYSIVAVLAIIGPILIGKVVANGSKEEWDKVFYVIIAISYLPLIVFNIWGTAEIQWWAGAEGEDNPVNIDNFKHARYSVASARHSVLPPDKNGLPEKESGFGVKRMSLQPTLLGTPRDHYRFSVA